MTSRLSCALVSVFLFGPLAAADLTITFTSAKKGVGAAAAPGTEIHYYTTGYLMTRAVEARQDVEVDFRQGVTFTINHAKKTIGRLSFDDAAAAMETLAKSTPETANPMMASLFGDPNDVKVTQKGTETIAGRTCQVWQITVGKLTMDLSADPTLKPPMPDAAYARMMKLRGAQAAQPGPMGATFKRLYEEMAKVRGIPLRTHMTGMMGMDIATLATRVETGPVPASTFTLPAGYTMEDMGRRLRENKPR